MSLLKTPPRVSQRPPRQLDPELELLAYWMDTVFEIPGLGIRFGFHAIIGLIPGIGDLLTSLISLYVLAAARRYGVPRATLMRMAFTTGVDTLVGAIPLFGDAFDVYWKDEGLERLEDYPRETNPSTESDAKSDARSPAILADPDLARIVAVWPSLSADVKGRILAFVSDALRGIET